MSAIARKHSGKKSLDESQLARVRRALAEPRRMQILQQTSPTYLAFLFPAEDRT